MFWSPGTEIFTCVVALAKRFALGAVCPVELAPPAVAVGAQPEVRLLHVAEQQELAHLPQR